MFRIKRIRLSDKEVEKLTQNMSRSEKKEFWRRQEELERDRADKEAWHWAMGDWDDDDF